MTTHTKEPEKPAPVKHPAKADQANGKPKLSKQHARILLTRLDGELKRAQFRLDQAEQGVARARRHAESMEKAVKQLKDRIQEIERSTPS